MVGLERCCNKVRFERLMIGVKSQSIYCIQFLTLVYLLSISITPWLIRIGLNCSWNNAGMSYHARSINFKLFFFYLFYTSLKNDCIECNNLKVTCYLSIESPFFNIFCKVIKFVKQFKWLHKFNGAFALFNKGTILLLYIDRKKDDWFQILGNCIEFDKLHCSILLK
jgi:hypothetical protein